MKSVKQYVGLDVHKETIAIAVAPGDPGLEVQDRGTIRNDWNRLLKRLTALGRREDLFVAYEAGPTGYGLYRRFTDAGISCIVVAPSKTPRRPGEKVKNDRLDAQRLARYLRAGELTAVTPPGREQEALRDALRAREDTVRALRRARQQLSGFLLRHDRRWMQKTTWGVAHMDWIRSQRFDSGLARQQLIAEPLFSNEVQEDGTPIRGHAGEDTLDECPVSKLIHEPTLALKLSSPPTSDA